MNPVYLISVLLGLIILSCLLYARKCPKCKSRYREKREAAKLCDENGHYRQIVNTCTKCGYIKHRGNKFYSESA